MSIAVKRYRKRPVSVEAVRLSASNITDVAHWCGGRVDGRIVEQSIYGSSYQDLRYLSIPTLEGVMRADIGDYIIRGVQGEFYPCDPEIFAKTYEEES
jgi:hypothetical protein